MRWLLSLIIFIPVCAFAQVSSVPDSMVIKLHHSKPDSTRVDILNDIALFLYDFKDKEALKYAEQAMALSKKLNYKKGLGTAYFNRSNIYSNTGKADAAKADMQKAIDLFIEVKYMLFLAYSYNSMGWIMRTQGRQSQALIYFQKGADIFEKINAPKGLGNSFSLIADNYNELGEHNKALAFYKKAYALRIKNKETTAAAQSLAGIGITYRFMQTNKPGDKNGELAIQYMFKAAKVFNKNKDDRNISLINKEIGVTFLKQSRYQTALKYLLDAEKVFKTLDSQRELGALYNALGKCYLNLGQLPKAKIYIEKAIVAAKAERSREHTADSYQSLYKYYKLTGNSQLALLSYEKWIAEKDSIDINSNFEKLAELTHKYEAEKKEQQINILNKENTIQKLSIIKQKTTLGIVAGLSIALLVFGSLLYNRNKNKQKIMMQQQQLAQRAEMTKAVIEAEEKERTRIASDLHDGVGQLFSAVKLNLNGLIERAAMPRDEDRFLAEKTLALVDESCKEVRYMSHQMMPNMLLKSGIAADVKSFVEKIDSERLKVRVEANGFKNKLESNAETVLYRVIQEAVNNVIKHANATLLDIKLTRETAGISATITDNGRGFDTSAAEGFTGIGLKSIAARVDYLKGTVDYRSGPGAGTSLRVWVPV